MRLTCFFMFIIFAVFAYLQGNDLDQYQTQLWFIWILLYGACSLTSIISCFKPLPRMLYAFFCLSSFVAAVFRFSALTPNEQVFSNPNNPAGNEGGGLMIVAAWFGMLAWRYAALGKKAKHQST